MNQSKIMTLVDLLNNVKGLVEQLRLAREQVKQYFKTTKVQRTPENMEQVANIMRVMYGAHAVVGLTAQGSIEFRDEAARKFFFREVNPYIPALRKRSTQARKVNPEKLAMTVAKRLKAKYGKATCKLLGALLMS